MNPSRTRWTSATAAHRSPAPRPTRRRTRTPRPARTPRRSPPPTGRRGGDPLHEGGRGDGAAAALTLSVCPYHSVRGVVGGEAAPFTFPDTDDFEIDQRRLSTSATAPPSPRRTGRAPTSTPSPAGTPSRSPRSTCSAAPPPSPPLPTPPTPTRSPGSRSPARRSPRTARGPSPATASATHRRKPAELRVNATGAKDGGWLTAYAAGTTRPSASTLNFPAGQNASNQETITPGATGDVDIYNGAASSVNVTVQAIGGFSANGAGDSYHPTNPTTLVDTRYGTGGITGPVGAGKTITVQVAGTNGVPANAQAVTLDVAENTTKAAGSLTVAPYRTAASASPPRTGTPVSR